MVVPDPRAPGALCLTILAGLATYAATISIIAYPEMKGFLKRAP
jgi:hypothetical protein